MEMFGDLLRRVVRDENVLAERHSRAVLFHAARVVDGRRLTRRDGVADFGPGHVFQQQRLRLAEQRRGNQQQGETEFHRGRISQSVVVYRASSTALAPENPRSYTKPMRNIYLAVFLCSALSGPAAAQWLDYKEPGRPRTPDGKVNVSAPAPRSADGKPDFTGVWNRISTKYDANITADLKPEDVQPWARELVKERMENLGRDHMFIKCLPVGAEYSVAQRFMKLVQTPALIVILEEDLVYRQIYMDGRPLEKDPQPSWMGYSVGHWEGNTLVVDSAGFNDKTWLDTQGHPHTGALKMRERIRRPDFGHLINEVTLEDPTIYAKPWTVKIESLLAADTQLIENVCLENSKLEHFVGKASDELKNEKKIVSRFSYRTGSSIRGLCANERVSGSYSGGRSLA